MLALPWPFDRRLRLASRDLYRLIAIAEEVGGKMGLNLLNFHSLSLSVLDRKRSRGWFVALELEPPM